MSEDLKKVVSMIGECTAPQDFLYLFQKQTEDILFWNGSECIYYRLGSKPPMTSDSSNEDESYKLNEIKNFLTDVYSVTYADEETLEICFIKDNVKMVCWSSHPLVFKYFKKDKK